MTAINFPMLILFVTITSYIYGNSFELCGAQLPELRSNRNFLGTFITIYMLTIELKSLGFQNVLWIFLYYIHYNMYIIIYITYIMYNCSIHWLNNSTEK